MISENELLDITNKPIAPRHTTIIATTLISLVTWELAIL